MLRYDTPSIATPPRVCPCFRFLRPAEAVPLYQARQACVTHLQICLESPVKLAAPVAGSRLFSIKLCSSFDHPTSEPPAPALFRDLDQRVLGVQPSTLVLPFWTSWGKSALTGASNSPSLLRLAPSTTVSSALLFLPTDRIDSRPLLVARARSYPDSASGPLRCQLSTS